MLLFIFSKLDLVQEPYYWSVFCNIHNFLLEQKISPLT